MDPEVLPHEHLAARFAKQLTLLVNEGRTKNAFSKLVLVSEPKFLGVLKQTMNGQLKNLLAGTLGKDLAHVPDHQMQSYVQPLLIEIQRQSPSA